MKYIYSVVCVLLYSMASVTYGYQQPYLDMDVLLSPSGYGLIIAMFALSFVFGFAYRRVLKKLFPRTNRAVHKNIKPRGRISRAVLGAILFVAAIFTTWSPWLLFAAGFCFFEAIFSRCGLYAAIGKNECPL